MDYRIGNPVGKRTHVPVGPLGVHWSRRLLCDSDSHVRRRRQGRDRSEWPTGTRSEKKRDTELKEQISSTTDTTRFSVFDVTGVAGPTFRLLSSFPRPTLCYPSPPWTPLDLSYPVRPLVTGRGHLTVNSFILGVHRTRKSKKFLRSLNFNYTFRINNIQPLLKFT